MMMIAGLQTPDFPEPQLSSSWKTAAGVVNS